MKKNASLYILLFLSAFSLLYSGVKIKEKDLPAKYRNFLDLTHYIILSEEKDVFMQLASNIERDTFIKTFWKQRDPTPGTPQNEFREEHIERFNHANKIFRRQTVRPGWKTDQGMFYIILGEPVSKERFYGTLGLYPCEIWYYYGDKTKGLPVHFGLVFYQRGGIGEFKLYDPVSDGPGRLMIHSKGFAMEDYRSMYEKIRELAPTLSLVALSIIPGDIPYNYTPSPQNTIMLAEIIESPKKNINPTYATHFLDYKGMVSTEYMENFIENDTQLSLIKDPIMGITFLHFSIAPKSIPLDYYEPKDQYFSNFNLTVSLRVKEQIIFQYRRNFPFYFSPEDLDKIRGNGISIEDCFPAIEGKYKLVILLQNSVAKEFSIFEKNITIPEDSESPQITSPLIGYKFQSYNNNMHIPFKVLDKKLVIDPKNNFAASEDISFFFILSNINQSLWDEGEVGVVIKGLKPENPILKSFNLRLNNYPLRKSIPVTNTISGGELSPDYYKMTLSLKDKNGVTIDEKTVNFIISTQEVIAHPIAHSKAFSLLNNYLYFNMMAHQYENVGEYEKAEASYEKAYEANPDYKKGLIEYAHFLFKFKKYGKSLKLSESIENDEKFRFDYYLIKGKAYMGMGDYSKAIENLYKGNEIYNSDISLLNSLGFCYYKTGKRENALNALKASLSLNSKQPDVKKLIDEIEKK